MTLDITGPHPPGEPLAPVPQNHQKISPRHKDTQTPIKKALANNPTLAAKENGAITTPSSKPPLKNRLTNNPNSSIISQQLQRMASLFYSSRALKHLTTFSPLKPLSLGNANDVYLKELLLSKKNDFFCDIYFKPGIDAAVRSKICYGLTQIFKDWQTVIAPAKETTANVISQEDYGIERLKVYNPDAKEYYLIKNEDIEESKELNKLIKQHDIELEAVDNHPGYYKITASKNEDYIGNIVMLYQKSINNHLKTTEDNAGISYVTSANSILEINDDSEVTINHVIYSIELTDEGFVLENPSMSANDLQKISKKYHLLSDKESGNQILALKTACTPFSYIIGGTTKKDKNTEAPNETRVEEESSEVSASESDVEDSSEISLSESETDDDAAIEHTTIWLNDDAIHTVNGRDFLKRNDQNYEIFNNNGKYSVIGKNIRGMAQLKVDNVFKKPAGSEKSLNLLIPSKERTEFYSRIDMPSFIHAFTAAILLRPQDGKVTDLGESNVLFQALPNEKGVIDPQDPSCKLRPVHIDHDETMPKGNSFTQLPEFEGKPNVHCVRNGLMGFPQANKPLSKDERVLAEKNLDEIIAKKEEVQKFLKRFIGKKEHETFNQEHIDAYTEVVNRIEEFRKEKQNKEWTLTDLFFHVFPEYEEQWEELGPMSPEHKAMYIGLESPEDVLNNKFA